MASSFFFFFRQATELIAYVPLFTETDKFTQAKFYQCKLTARGPPFRFYLFYVTYKTEDSKGSHLSFFFRHCANYFSKVFNVSKESPLQIFCYFATESMFMNLKGSPHFIFGTMRRFRSFFQKKIFKKNFPKKFSIFFCFQTGKVIFQSYRA